MGKNIYAPYVPEYYELNTFLIEKKFPKMSNKSLKLN